MPSDSSNSNGLPLPEGYVAIPLTAQQSAAPLRLGVVVRREAEPVGGHLVVLRDLLDAKVLLGCVFDAGGHVHRWLELWVQDLSGFSQAAQTLTVARDALSNSVLDARWQRQYRLLDEMGDSGLIRTGWEQANPPPMFVDPARGEPFHPSSPDSGGKWMLCTSDALLAAKRLPPYGTSLHRYLFQPDLGDGSQFVPVTEGALTNEHTRDLESVLPRDRRLIPLNPSGSLLLVRSYSPVTLEELLRFLGGDKPDWRGVQHGASRLPIGGLPADGDEPSANGWLFLGRQGRGGRFVECFHLKARLFADLVDGTRRAARDSQRPLLNLRPESFQIETEVFGAALPALWNRRARLVDPGDAIALKIPSGETKYYIPARPRGLSVYLPPEVGEVCQGTGLLQMLRVHATAGGLSVIEGTFSTRDLVRAAKNDMMWLRLGIGGRRVNLYARLSAQAGIDRGELNFRTVGQRFSPEIAEKLSKAVEVPFPSVPFEIIPLLSTPCDLYSLGVLAVLTFLVNPQQTLGSALGQVLSLSRSLGRQTDRAKPLARRIAELVNSDPRLLDGLGPHRLWREPMTPANGLNLLPEELWWDTLAMIVKMFPGEPDSTCRDFGDAPAGAVHRVFDTAVSDVESLLVRSRSLVVVDWGYNLEVRAVIEDLKKRP